MSLIRGPVTGAPGAPHGASGLKAPVQSVDGVLLSWSQLQWFVGERTAELHDAVNQWQYVADGVG